MKKAGIVSCKLVDSLVLTADNDGYTDITNVFNGVRWISEPTFWLKAVEDTNGSTLDIDIEVSQDNGTTKVEVISFTQLSASGNELVNATKRPWGQKIYMKSTVSAGGGQFTVNLYAQGPAESGPAGK